MKTESRIKKDIILLIPLAVFVYFACALPVGITNDSPQYVYMHIRRDPLYSFFLWILRLITGESLGDRQLNADTVFACAETLKYLKIAVWIQNIFAWVSIASVTVYFRKRFSLKWISTAVICAIACAPHFITPIAAHTNLVMSNTIMSEAIALPLFYLFVIDCIKVLDENKTADLAAALLEALLLSLTRGQMMVFIIVWLIVAVAAGIKFKKETAKRIRGLLLVIVAFCLTFTVRSVAVKTYNLYANGYYMNTTFGGVSLLTNVLYASTPDMAQYIEDDEARRFFNESITLIEEQHLNYTCSESGFLNRARDIDEKHDLIKFKCIDEVWRPIHDAEYPALQSNYELETEEQDRVAGIIARSLLPHCFGTWLYDYLALSVYGFIRTVAVVNPLLNIYALLVYIFVIAALIWLIKTNKAFMKSALECVVLLTLLLVCANTFATATVIMCLSRYMIYTLPFMYISAFLLLKEMCATFIGKAKADK